MRTMQITVNVPEFSEFMEDDIREAVLSACVDRVLGNFVSDEDELIEGRRGDDPDDFKPARKKVDGAFLTKLRQQVEEHALMTVKGAVEQRVPALVDEVLNGTFQPVTRWGETSAPTTLRAMIGKFGTDYLNATVDAKGSSSGYDANNSKVTRLHFLISQMVPQVYAASMKGFVEEQAAEVKRAFANRVSGEITETVQRLLGLPVTLSATAPTPAKS